jgi:hypothetical protein
MPPDYLKRPQLEGAEMPGTSKATPDLAKMVDTLIGDVLFLRNVLNTVLMAVERSIPAAGAEIEAGLKQIPGADHRYVKAAQNAIRNARAAKASQQLDDLRQRSPLGRKKTAKQGPR